MNLDKYRIFLMLSRQMRLSDIANQLSISQPTVSFHLKSLEEEFQIQLYDSSNKSLALTKEATKLIPYIMDIVQLDDAMHKKAEQIKLLGNDEIQIGSSLSPSISLLPQVLSEFTMSYPNTRITIDIDSANMILERLNLYQYDFVLISSNKNLPEEFQSYPLFHDQLVWVIPQSYASYFKDQTDLRFISQLKFIQHSINSSTRVLVDRILNEQGIKPNSIITVNSVEVIKRLIRKEIGISILPLSMIQVELEQNQLLSYPINSSITQKSIQLVYHKNQSQTFLIESLITMIKAKKKI